MSAEKKKRVKNRYEEHEGSMKEDFHDYPCEGCKYTFCTHESFKDCPHWRAWFYRTWKNTRATWKELLKQKG